MVHHRSTCTNCATTNRKGKEIPMNIKYTNSSAKISDCGTYRYELIREWSTSEFAPNTVKEGQVVFCLLNPSTADAVEDDRTITRCVGFAQDWGYSRLVVVNLYAYRTPDPDELPNCSDPVGANNDEYIIKYAKEADLFIAGWGRKRKRLVRDKIVLDILRSSGIVIKALGVNADGTPKHPLYLSKKTNPRPYI